MDAQKSRFLRRLASSTLALRPDFHEQLDKVTSSNSWAMMASRDDTEIGVRRALAVMWLVR
jgi:hydrogenase maturation factor